MRYKPYPKYKESGVAWLGEVPEGWEISKLRFIFSFNKGLTITKANLKNKGIPCVNYGEIHSKYGFEVSSEKHELKCVDSEYLITSKSSLLSKGDFVFADTSEDIEGAGNFTHLSGETQVFAGYHTIIGRQINEHNFRFLAYLIDSEAFRTQVRLSVKGVKVFSITQVILKNCIVWLPKIEEQKKIATYLDQKTQKIDTLIEKQQTLIKLLKEKRALISHAVTKGLDDTVKMKDSGVAWLGEVPEGWDVTKIKYKVNLIDGDRSSEYPNDKDYVDSGIPFISSKNIVDSKLINKNLKFISESKFQKLGRGKLKHNDLVITVRGTIGHVGVFDKNLMGCNTGFINAQMMIMRVVYMNFQFLFYLTKSTLWNKQIDLLAYGSTVKQLSNDIIGNLSIPFPPLKEQKNIAQYLDQKNNQIDTLISKSTQAIELLKERRSALISAVVTGKVDVREDY